MNVRHLTAAAALALAATHIAAAEPAGADRLIALVPAESSMVVLINDVPGFLESWPSTPLGRTWNEPEVKKFLAPLRDTMELDRWEDIVREGTGYALSEILDSFTGPAALATIDLMELMEADESGKDPPILMLAEVADDGNILRELFAADLESDKDKAGEGTQLEAAEEEFRGETLHFRRRITADSETETNFWAIVDSIAVVAGSKDLLQQIVTGIKGTDGSASLASNQQFQEIRTRFSPYDTMLYMNIAEFVPMMLESIRESEARAEEERNELEEGDIPAPPPNPPGITGESVFEALGLGSFKSAAFAYRFGEETTRIDSGITYDEGPGLVRILQAYRPGPVELPEFIPDDVLNASVTNLSFAMIWRAMREALEEMNPEVDGSLETQLAQLKTNTGIDIEGSLLSSLGERVLGASFRKPATGPGSDTAIGEPDQLFGIALVDRQGLELVLELAKNLVSPLGISFDEQEFLDQTIYISKMPVTAPAVEGEDPTAATGAPPGFSYALTPDYLFISVGTAEPIRTVLSRMRRPGHSIWAQPEVRSALEVFPESASSMSYMDFPSLIMQFFNAFAAIEKHGDQHGDQEEKEPLHNICDPDAIPDKDVLKKILGVAVGAVFREPGGLYMTTRVHAAVP